jgi:hypothetical protein
MLEQKQHLFISYFKTLSVTPARELYHDLLQNRLILNQLSLAGGIKHNDRFKRTTIRAHNGGFDVA